MDNQTMIGVDAGGTKVKVGRVTEGRIVAEVCLPTKASSPEFMIIEDIIFGIEQVMTPEVVGIGIGVPGLVDKENGIVYNVTNIPSWKEVYLKRQLEKHFGIPVNVSNDANCFALGEKHFGKGEPYKNLVCITLGTGVGAGIIINNHLHSGLFSTAGEYGALPYLQHDFEYYCSGKFFHNYHNNSGKEFYEKALSGDIKAIRVFDEYGDHLGNLIQTVLFTLGPEAIILGGSVAQSFRFFQKAMMENISKFPYKQVTNQLVIELSKNDGIAVIGAAALCLPNV